MGSIPNYQVMECRKRTFFMNEKSHKYWLAYSFHCCLLNMLGIFLSCNWGINQEMIKISTAAVLTVISIITVITKKYSFTVTQSPIKIASIPRCNPCQNCTKFQVRFKGILCLSYLHSCRHLKPSTTLKLHLLRYKNFEYSLNTPAIILKCVSPHVIQCWQWMVKMYQINGNERMNVEQITQPYEQ